MITTRRVQIPGLISVMGLLYWWLQAAILIMVPPRFSAVSSGQGDLFTRCQEWRLVFMVMAVGSIFRGMS